MQDVWFQLELGPTSFLCQGVGIIWNSKMVTAFFKNNIQVGLRGRSHILVCIWKTLQGHSCKYMIFYVISALCQIQGMTNFQVEFLTFVGFISLFLYYVLYLWSGVLLKVSYYKCLLNLESFSSPYHCFLVHWVCTNIASFTWAFDDVNCPNFC